MQVNEENLNGLRGYLEQTYNPNTDIRRNAEKFLTNCETQIGFPVLVLTVIEQSTDPAHAGIRQAAAVLFKNFVKKHWEKEENKPVQIPDADRNLIKSNLVNLMCSVPDQIQKQLSAALSTIGEYDFPEHWQNLLPELVSKFNADWRLNNGVLQTANTIFKRFRHAFKSDELYKDLKHCLDSFQKPLLELFQFAGQSLNTAGNDKAQVVLILHALRTMARIFYSLNWQDLPAFFEDHIQAWMKEFNFYLQYDNPLLMDPNEEDEPSALDLLKQAIVENLNLYVEKYDEEFQPFKDTFTKLIWDLLSKKITNQPKHDLLAATCMKFLRAVALQQTSKALFEQKGALEEICNTIVVSNLQLRSSDEELFEDNPMDYIRRDIEGSDGDTRRAAARELVRGLLRNFNGPVTAICLNLVNQMLTQYATDPVHKWQLKDVSINLFIAIAVTKQSKAHGVSELNPGVPIMEFFNTHILPELSNPNSSTKLLKADEIKFVSTFRSQLPTPMMQQIVPMLIQLLLPEHFVVHTYAASCLERLMTVKDPNTKQPRFGRQELNPHLHQILTGLFGIMEIPNYPENDYLIKAVMRVINVAKEDIIPVTDTAVTKLTGILTKICANPSNPVFSHYLFEALSVLVLNVCKSNPVATEQFESLLFPPFQNVLTADVEALCPYVYQVLAQLLELRPHGISASYMSMFPVLLTPALWERVSNVTAMVKLITAYLRKDPNQVLQYLQGILGVFQKLISSRSSEANAFSLLRSIFGYLPLASYESYAGEIFRILMLRLQSRLNSRMSVLYIKEMIYSLSVFIGKNGSITLFEGLEKIQAGMGVMLIKDIWIVHLAKIRGVVERKTTAIGSTRILCELSQLQSDVALWAKLLESIVLVLEDIGDATEAKDVDDQLQELEETGYEAGYSKLFFASTGVEDMLAEMPPAKQYLAQSLSKLSASRPGTFPAILQQHLPPKAKEPLQSYFALAKVAIQ